MKRFWYWHKGSGKFVQEDVDKLVPLIVSGDMKTRLAILKERHSELAIGMLNRWANRSAQPVRLGSNRSRIGLKYRPERCDPSKSL